MAGVELDPKIIAELERQQSSVDSSLESIDESLQSISESLEIVALYLKNKGGIEGIFTDKDFE